MAGVRAPGQGATAHQEDELRRTIGDLLEDTGVEWMLRAKTGDAFSSLVRVADEEHADAVVVGASAQRRTLHRRPVSSRLTALARYPVIVVP